jgi:hypothetical protein
MPGEKINYRLQDYLDVDDYYTLMLKTDPPDMVEYITANEEISSTVIKPDQNPAKRANLIFEWFYSKPKSKDAETFLYLLDLGCIGACSVYRLQILAENASIIDVKEIG